MNPGGDATTIDLRSYLTALWRRKMVIVLVVATVVGTAMTLSYRRQPLYRASAQVLLQPSLQEQILDPQTNTYTDPVRAQKTEMQIITSPAVADAVAKKLGYAAGVSVTALADTDIVFIEGVDAKPARAAAIANAYVASYITFRHQQQVDDLTAAAGAVQSQIASLQKQIDALKAPAPLAVAPSTTVPGGRTTDTTVVDNPQADALLNQQIILKQKLDQIQVSSSLSSGGAQRVADAAAPSTPFTPNHRRDGALAIAVGLVFGIGVALLWEVLDDSIDGAEELERAVPGVPTFALIPRVKGWRAASQLTVISLTEPDSPSAESYRSLRTAIHFARLDQELAVLQVTSPSASEGKSTTVANLGVAFARAGKQVIIVCADLRRPRVHEFFGLDNKVGLTSVMLGESSLREACQDVPNQPRLRVLASGPIPPNPSELLASRRASDVMKALRQAGALVIVDSPPVLPVSDAALISSQVDATLVVVDADTTTRRRLHGAIKLLRRVDAPIIGTVLNGAGQNERYGYERYAPESPSRRNSVRADGNADGASNGHSPTAAKRSPKNRT